jgi:hypothetical protein
VGEIPPQRNVDGHLTVNRKAHWEHVHTVNSPTEVSWFQPEPTLSLRLLEAAGLAASS